MLQRNGKVYTEIVPDCAKVTLQAIIRGKADLGSLIHSDGWRGYNGLIDLGYKKHFRVQFLLVILKRRLLQVHSVPHHAFYLHLKETVFRFNYRNDYILNATSNDPKTIPYLVKSKNIIIQKYL